LILFDENNEKGVRQEREREKRVEQVEERDAVRKRRRRKIEEERDWENRWRKG
jgi:hypothetical protein